MIENSIYNIRKIFLILGTACNFDCVYCVQHENRPRCRRHISEDVIEWLEKIAYRLPLCLKPRIVFYGGEPLLYRKTIHEIVDRFRDKFFYGIISNGSELNDEDIEYFNANKVRFTFSNDGRGTPKTRQVNMFEDVDFVNRFNRLNDRSVDAVYSSVTQDLYDLAEYVEEKSPGTQLTVEDIICNSLTEDWLVEWDELKLLETYRRMGEETQNFLKNKSTEKSLTTAIWMKWVKTGISNYRNPQFPDFGVCGAGNSAISVDLEGNVYLCKNFNIRIGSVHDSYETLWSRAKDETKALRDKNLEAKGCFDCKSFFHCRGGCPFEEASDQQTRRCRMTQIRCGAIDSYIKNKLNVGTVSPKD